MISKALSIITVLFTMKALATPPCNLDIEQSNVQVIQSQLEVAIADEKAKKSDLSFLRAIAPNPFSFLLNKTLPGVDEKVAETVRDIRYSLYDSTYVLSYYNLDNMMSDLETVHLTLDGLINEINIRTNGNKYMYIERGPKVLKDIATLRREARELEVIIHQLILQKKKMECPTE